MTREPSLTLRQRMSLLPSPSKSPVASERAASAHHDEASRAVGRSVTGEPGVLTMRAGGTLDLKGSITDGSMLSKLCAVSGSVTTPLLST